MEEADMTEHEGMSSAGDAPDNMAIWNVYCVTPPGVTRRVKLGRREYTAIDAYYQIEQATRLWGPIGKGWGCDRSYEIVGSEPHALAVAHIEFWYGGDRATRFPVTSAAKLYQVAKNQSGKDQSGNAARTDEKYTIDAEAHKKALTDAITKALSYLGFAADVFQGKFDDNKYVAERRREEAAGGGNGAGTAALPEGRANGGGNGGVVTSARQQAAMIARRMGIPPTDVIETLKHTYDVSRMEDLSPALTETFLSHLRECAALHAKIQEHFGDRPATPVLKGWLKAHNESENLLLVALDQWYAWATEFETNTYVEGEE
jgi:hypothetical protein